MKERELKSENGEIFENIGTRYF